MGFVIGALTLGSAAPHLVRGLGARVNWSDVIIATSTASVMAAILFLLFAREGPYSFEQSRVDIRQFASILRNRPLMLANIAYFGHMWELYAMWAWLLTYATAANSAGISILGGNPSLFVFIVIGAGTVGCVAGGMLSDWIGRCYTTVLIMAISGLSAISIGFFFEGPAWAFGAIAVVWGITVVADSGQFSAAVTELAEVHQVGSALAFQMGIGFAITIFIIWLLPVIADAFGGWRWAFIVLAPGPAAGVMAMMLLRRLPEARLMAGGQR